MNEPNEYDFGELDERWEEEQATTIARLNKSRVKVDHIKTAVHESGFMDSDYPVTSPYTLARGSLVRFPDSVESSYNARRVIFVDLDDPLQVWDLAAFMQQARETSWYDELGVPPVHGAMWASEDLRYWYWWDREAGSVYMTWESQSLDMLMNASTIAGPGVFLDGKVFVAAGAGGARIFDLLTDGASLFNTGGHYRYDGNLSERNDGKGWVVMDASKATVDNTVNAIAACRDPELLDEFGRPKHWWAAGTAAEGSLYSPVDEAIYDWSTAGAMGATTHLDLSPGGGFVWRANDGTRDRVMWDRNIFGVTADWVGYDAQWHNAMADAEQIAWTNAAAVSATRVLPGKSISGDGTPLLVLGSDEGLYVAHANAADNAGEGALIRMTADYNSPLMVGDVRACWPLHAVTDVSPAGHTLTNNNTVTFSSGGPAGSYADFAAASSMSLELADHADVGGMSELSIMGWLYRDVDSGGNEGIIGKWDLGGGDNSFSIYIATTDYLIFYTDTSAGQVYNTSNPYTVPLSSWVHFAVTYDGEYQRMYIQGELVDTDAQSGTIDDSAEKLFIGAMSTADVAQSFFDGRLAGMVITATTMTQTQIRYEYQRGVRRMNATYDTIPATDVDAVCVDPHGRYFGVVADDKLTIFDEFAVPVAQDAIATGSLRDACIKSDRGADTPRYIMGASTTVEIVQPDLRIMG